MSELNIKPKAAPELESAETVAAGVDVGKHWLDLAFSNGGQVQRFSNTQTGIERLIAAVQLQPTRLVGFEATGGYENGLRIGLQAQGLDVLHLQPLQVKAFAQLHKQLAKSDKIDAKLIANCTKALAGFGHGSVDLRLIELAGFLTLIDQISEDMARAKTRRETAPSQTLKDWQTTHYKRLHQERSTLTKALILQVKAHPDLAQRFNLITSIEGIGERTALMLVIRMPELGSVSRQEAACLIGAAPIVRESGIFKGQRHVGGGRKRVRTALYACTQAAILHNPALKDFYARLMKTGKHHRTAIMACTRKLIIYANTILERRTPWTKIKIQSAA